MNKRLVLLVLVLMAGALVLGACSTATTPAPTAEAEEDHADEGDHAEGEEDDHADEGDDHADEGDDHANDEDDHADDGHEEEAHGPDEHTFGHEIPEDAASVENPIEATEASLEAGQQLYADNCSVCHGEDGEGEGPGAAGLEPPPADLHEDHVQVLSDGALFYILSHGVEDTAMPAWEESLTEEELWHLVNYIRTFAEE